MVIFSKNSPYFPVAMVCFLALTLVRCSKDDERVAPHSDDLSSRDSTVLPVSNPDSLPTDSIIVATDTTGSLPDSHTDSLVKSPTDSTPMEASARARVIQDYEDNYLVNQALDLRTWDGSTDGCRPGRTSEETLQRVLNQVNYFRRQTGLNDDIVFDEEKNRKSQLSSLMMHANGTLDHAPPTSWKCYDEDGAQAASKANLAQSSGGYPISFVHERPRGIKRRRRSPPLDSVLTRQRNGVWYHQ